VEDAVIMEEEAYLKENEVDHLTKYSTKETTLVYNIKPSSITLLTYLVEEELYFP